MVLLQSLALMVILAAAGWLAFVTVLCLVGPDAARAGLARMGSTPAIHFGEHGLRALAGLALLVRAVASKFPELMGPLGWFLIASSAIIMLLPRRWHHAYAAWWAEHIPRWAYRVTALPTAMGAAALAYAAL